MKTYWVRVYLNGNITIIKSQVLLDSASFRTLELGLTFISSVYILLEEKSRERNEVFLARLRIRLSGIHNLMSGIKNNWILIIRS